MKKNGNLIHVQLTALHIILKWMRFSFFGSFANAVVITSLYLSSLLFSFLLIISTRSCRRLSKSKKDKTDKKSKKDTKNKKDKKGKNDKKYEKAKKTEKGRKDFAMTLTIKPGIDYDYDIACQKEESTMTLQVSGFDTIGEVKRMIEDMRRLEGRPPAIYSNRVGLADAYTLAFIFGNRVGLADANTLMFYNIPERAHLRLEVE